MSKREPVLVSQQQALWDYLDALLQEIPEEYPETEAAVALAEPVLAPVLAPPVVARAEPEIQEWDPGSFVEEAPVVEAECVAELAPSTNHMVEAPAAPAAPIAEPEPVAATEPDPELPPAWARAGFQALLFKVNGLTLAVPLIKLHSVIPWEDDKLATMPNQPAWCFGLLRYREQNVRVVDTATLVIPEDKRPALEREPPKHLLIVGDGRWGLACSAIGDVVKLGANEVKWRSRGGRRPWLAGTVLGHLCALMDTEAFAEMLETRRR